MSGVSPSELVARVLVSLSGIDPHWTLSGGGALVYVHLGHRTTKDLDLFWHGFRELGRLPAEVLRRLHDSGLTVVATETSPGFVRLRVTDTREVVLIDLVATPTEVVDGPERAVVAGQPLWVDSPHEILTNKLTALLSRSEIRDLIDIRALVDAGGDLERALRDAPRKDGGFSNATLAWVLNGFPVHAIARGEGLSATQIDAIEAFRVELVDRLTRLAAPE